MFTILGATGFVGSHLVKRLAELQQECLIPNRDEELSRRKLGDVIYCIGLTADFRSKPFETVDAHVCKLRQLLKDCEFDSLLYLSSTRLYGARTGIALEDEPIQAAPLQPDHLYNISKAMGESLTLSCGRRGRVVRLSAAYGRDFESENFLTTIMRDAILTKEIVLQTSVDSERDYISVDDVVELLLKIAASGRERIYNVASGKNVSHLELTNKISEFTGCRIEVMENAPRVSFPTINIDRIRKEFDFHPAGDVLTDVQKLVESYRADLTQGKKKT